MRQHAAARSSLGSSGTSCSTPPPRRSALLTGDGTKSRPADGILRALHGDPDSSPLPCTPHRDLLPRFYPRTVLVAAYRVTDCQEWRYQARTGLAATWGETRPPGVLIPRTPSRDSRSLARTCARPGVCATAATNRGQRIRIAARHSQERIRDVPAASVPVAPTLQRSRGPTHWTRLAWQYKPSGAGFPSIDDRVRSPGNPSRESRHESNWRT